MNKTLGFQKRQRLLNKSDFNNLRENPYKLKEGPIRVFYKDNPYSQTRIGVSISKKAGNAVFRNKCKRLVREAFRKSEYRNASKDILFVISNNIDKSQLNSSINKNVIKVLERCDS